MFMGRTNVEVETPILWPPVEKSWLIRKDPDAEKDWRWEEKGMTRMIPRLLRLLHWRVLHCQCHLRSQTALRAMYRGQERRRLRRTVLTDVLIISQWQRREIKKKIPLKIEGLHCRVIQATSHSARGRERERHPAGFLRGFTVLWKRQAKDTDLLRTRLFKPICSRRELC